MNLLPHHSTFTKKPNHYLYLQPIHTSKSKTKSSHSSKQLPNNLKTKRKQFKFTHQKNRSYSPYSNSSQSNSSNHLKHTIKKNHLKSIKQIKHINNKIKTNLNSQSTQLKTQRNKYQISKHIQKYILNKKTKQQQIQKYQNAQQKHQTQKIKNALNQLENKRLKKITNSNQLKNNIKKTQSNVKHNSSNQSIQKTKKNNYKNQYFQTIGKKIPIQQFKIVINACITIQKYWRGYMSRKKYKKQLNQIHQKIKKIKKRIKNKQHYWYDDSSDNSVIKLKLQIDSESEIMVSNKKQATKKFMNGNILNSNQKLNQAQTLRRQIQNSKQKNRTLEIENNFLKNIIKKPNNIPKLSGLLNINIEKDNHQQEESYRTPISYQTNKSSQQMQMKVKQVQSELKQILSQSQQSQNEKNIMNQQLSSLSSFGNNQNNTPIKSLINSSHKKYILPDEVHPKTFSNVKNQYHKSKQMLQRMFKNKLLSPNTYQAKKLILFNKYKLQNKIQNRQIKQTSIINESSSKQQLHQSPNIERHVIAKKINMATYQQNLSTNKNSPQTPNKKINLNVDSQSSIQITQFKSINQFNLTNRQKQGFETDLKFIGKYCIQLCNYIRKKYYYIDIILDGISKTSQKKQIELLKAYRTDLCYSNNSNYNSRVTDYLYFYHKILIKQQDIVKHQWFEDFNETQYFFINPPTQLCTKSLNIIYLQAVYDAFNQALNLEKNNNKIYRFKKSIQTNYYELKQIQRQSIMDMFFGKSIDNLLSWANSLCGFIPQGNDDQQIDYDQLKVNQIRQKRLALMLHKDLLSKQEQIINFDDQKVQVKLFLGQQVMSLIVFQLLLEIKKICKY